ncbi:MULTISPECIES: PilW family protein [unclassified Cupriavidus]|uniref:PilW family protein n=1 Tax=unclassified Cupriavidus TaxID=2640874 RepID=UPI00313D714F
MRRPHAFPRRTRAFSLAGMLVGLSLGLLASIVAFVTFRIASVAYRDIVDHVMIEERGHRALTVLAHAIRHSGHLSPAAASVTLFPAAPEPAPVVGRDDCGARFVDAVDDVTCARAGVARSDALRVRLSGSGSPGDPTLPDGTMSDCGGYALPARATHPLYPEWPGERHAHNVFYIGRAADGVPQLMCRYPARRDGRIASHRHTQGPLVRGVETMQFRYGIDADDDGEIEDFLRAEAVRARGPAAWHAVRAVRIAIVMRGERHARGDGAPTLQLFDDGAFGSTPSPDDRFTPTRDLDRRRKVLTTTVRLRHPSSCREASC